MNRRDLLAAGVGLTLAEFPFRLASFLQASGERNHESDCGTTRHPVLVRSAFTRKSDGTDEPVTVQTMFSTEVVRSSDSDGRLAVYVFPVGSTMHVAARRFTCITNRMSGFTSWVENSSPKSAASACTTK